MAVGTRKYITIGISALVLAIILLIILFGVNRRPDISDPQNFTEQFRSCGLGCNYGSRIRPIGILVYVGRI